jgi:23S rRNA pseudouridine1911/1915/1917 synthase
VHRLDKDTTGALVAAKNDRTHRALVQALAQRQIQRIYVALVHGLPEVDTALIDAPIGRHPTDRKRMAVNIEQGKEARTYFAVRERLDAHAVLECKLDTGRTHQIRVHLAYIGYPVVGDQTYGRSREEFGLAGQLLHAVRLEFEHPHTGEQLRVRAPLPADMLGVLEELGSEYSA